ncbi:MAG: glycoside hydrolase [Frankia sp.]|nr:glycoside hydrolase [Frankia sp.]
MRLTHDPGRQRRHPDSQATPARRGPLLVAGPAGIQVPAGTPLPPGTAFLAEPVSPGRTRPGAGGTARRTARRGPVPTRGEATRGAATRGRATRGQPALWRRRMPAAAVLAATAVALSTTTAFAAPNPAWPRGVDVSSWQHPEGAGIDWNAVKAAGNSFAIIKATEGGTYTNPHYVADRDGAKAAGLVVGAYHYARPALPISTAVDQARRFLAVAGDVRTPAQLAPVLDLEVTGGLSPGDLTAWAQAFLREVESLTGRTPILYTFRSFWTDKIANTPALAKYPLWFAIYNDGPDPGWLPGGWQNWLIWQYTSSAEVPGIQGRVDQNAFCCSPADLAARSDGTRDEIALRYASEPLLQLALGPPTRGEGPAGGGGRWQPFANGLMFWSVETGTRQLHGAIARKYLAMGGSNSSLGRPIEDVSWATAPDALQAVFEGGRIYWHPALGAYKVHGEILKRYLALGGSGSWLGLPISDEYDVPGGRESAFQNGKLRWNATTNEVQEIRNGPAPVAP